MVRKNITAYLDCVTDMIRKNYPTETVEDLEFIARKEFNVRHINHKFKEGMNTSCVYRNESMELVINYLAFTDIGQRLVLGHEIGHIAACHIGIITDSQVYVSNTPKKERENEANYFSARLNGLSDATDYLLLREAERKYLREIYYLAEKDFKNISADLKKVLCANTQSLKDETASLRGYAAELREYAGSLRKGGLFGI